MFCLSVSIEKRHVDMTRIKELLKILQVIMQFEENRNIANITLAENRFESLQTTV